MGLASFASVIWKKEGNTITDVLHGFRGLSRRAFSTMPLLDYGLSVDIEMVILSYKMKLKRVEFPSIEKKRPFGKSHFKALPTGFKLLKYLLCEMRRKI